MAINIYQEKFRQHRRENNLCLNCGKPLDRQGTNCIACREKINADVRERRKWYQDNGICPRCGKNDIYGDEKNCPECSAKSYILIMPKRENNREHYNTIHADWSRRTHQEMIEKGICTRCRKRKSDGGYKTCGICRAKDRTRKCQKYGKPNRQERYKQGLCFFCDNPIKEGYKVCEEHYQRNVENARSQKCNEARQNMIKQGILY